MSRPLLLALILCFADTSMTQTTYDASTPKHDLDTFHFVYAWEHTLHIDLGARHEYLRKHIREAFPDSPEPSRFEARPCRKSVSE